MVDQLQEIREYWAEVGSDFQEEDGVRAVNDVAALLRLLDAQTRRLEAAEAFLTHLYIHTPGWEVGASGPLVDAYIRWQQAKAEHEQVTE